ncbi:hypothetical protein M413DRAFT_32543 [Hebeloma cylindrosporum]|uniref:Ig-like domain-containing protein n=1 Tax=Hebeloma cylindrosporum TaxID=76867 RepID=A0A0C3BF02_HEBCY|nr:hypothetical protein M413DRAFT_32543 [Hebeloma cylindrosporum h7]
MQTFALVTLLSTLFAAGVNAGPYKRQDDPTDTPSSITVSFSGTPPSAFPSGTGAPYAAPTGGYGSGGPILICHPVDPNMHPDTSTNATLSATLSDPAPTSATPVPTDSDSGPSDGQGSGGPIYICHPIDSSAAPSPSGSATPSDAPSLSATGTDVPQPSPTDGQGSGDSIYLQCRPTNSSGRSAPSSGTPSDATPTPISDPAPTSAPSSSTTDA